MDEADRHTMEAAYKRRKEGIIDMQTTVPNEGVYGAWGSV